MESGSSHSTKVESCSSTVGTLASPGFQPWLLLESPGPSPPASLPHLSGELAQVFVQLPGELEQGNALARKENGYEWQFFTLMGVTVSHTNSSASSV